MGRSKAGYWARGAEQELERLDEAFMSVGEQVRAQKEAAQKWIRRQRIRMEVWMWTKRQPTLCAGCLFFLVWRASSIVAYV